MKRTLLFWSICLLMGTSSLAQWNVPLTPISGFYRMDAVHFLDANTGFTGGTDLLFGGSGIISKTTNGGTSWTTVATIPSSPINAIQFVNANLGFAVGVNGLIAKTTDGGNTWTTQNHMNPNSGSNEDFQDVHFLDQNTGYIAGGTFEMLVLKTTDGGNTWTQLTMPAYFQRLKAMHFLSASEGFVAGGDQFGGGLGRIYHTTDGGASWDTLSSGVSNYFNDIHFSDASNGVIGCGVDGIILKTSDGGQSWSQVTNPAGTSAMGQFSFVNSTLGYACTFGGMILKTTDAGSTWTVDADVSGTIFSLYAISTPTASFGIATGLSPLYAELSGGGSGGVGIDDVTAANDQFELYPNPSSGDVNLNFTSDLLQDGQLTITDLQGRTVFSEQLSGNSQVNLHPAGLTSGVYLVRIQAESYVGVKRLVISKN